MQLIGNGIGSKESVDAEVLGTLGGQLLVAFDHLLLGHAVLGIAGLVHDLKALFALAQTEGAARVIAAEDVLRHTGDTLQKFHHGGKLHVMAFHNVFRDKKRAALVFMSLFMGITMILGVNGVISSMSAENFIKEYMDYNFEYTDIQFEQYEQLNKEVPQFDEHFVEQIKQLDGIKNIDVQKTVWAGIDFNENDLEGFMKIKYEDSKYKAKGQSYEQTIETLKGYAESGDYGCYITTLPDDRVLEEYNAEHPDTPIDMEAFKRGETAIAGKDTEYNAPNTALVGETLTLTADSTDGKATDFKIGGAFYYDDYDNTLSEGIGRHCRRAESCAKAGGTGGAGDDDDACRAGGGSDAAGGADR